VRLAIVASHAIYYQVPIWRELSARAGLAVKAFYASDMGIRDYYEPDFAKFIRCDMPLLDGYQHAFLPNRPLQWLNWRYQFRCPSIYDELRGGGYDAILVVGKEYAYYLDAIRAANRLRIPVLYRAEWPVSRGGKLYTWIAEKHRALVYSRIDAFLCIGSRQFDFYGKYGVPREKMFWSPYCVDNTYFRMQAESLSGRRAELRRACGFTEGMRVIAFCGKLVDLKRPFDILHALGMLRDKDRYGALFIGTGPLQADVESVAKACGLRNVVVTGFVNLSGLARHYILADCLVLPSLRDNWGLVVNEAMNFGLPVIVSDRVGCAPDLVKDNGYVYPMGDVQALSRSLERVFATEDSAKDLGRRSLAIVDRFSVQAAADGIEQALRSDVVFHR
jgi:glycosyltransferase involved in cell wall biosynthesis